MNVYIWKSLDHMTSYYHEEAGLVVVAESLERVNELYPQTIDIAPDDILQCVNSPEKSFVFPDAGCC